MAKSDRILRLYLFIFFMSVYLLTSSGVYYESDASIARYEVTRSLVENHDLAIPDGYGLRGMDGRDYSWYGLGYSLFSVPFYILSRILNADSGYLVSLMNQLLGAATVILVFSFVINLGYTRRTSLIVSMLYGLGTFAWPLAKQTFEHVLETFFVLLSVILVHCYCRSRKTGLLLSSSLCLGFAFLTRSTSVLVIPGIFIFLFLYHYRHGGAENRFGTLAREISILLAGLIPFLSLFFWYNYYRFGSIFESGYSLIAYRTGIELFSGTPLLTGLAGFLVSPGKGFFYYSPVAILFFVSINSFKKKNPELTLCFISIILCYLFFFSKYTFWHGDWAWGPRYLLVITPFTIIPIAGLLDSHLWTEKAVLRKGVYGLLATGIIIQLAAVSVNYNKYFNYLRSQNKAGFTLVSGEGSPSVIEPEPKTYFDWCKSPILMQFGFIYDAVRACEHKKSVFESGINNGLKNLSVDGMNQIDFWWIYQYSITRDKTPFVTVFALIMLVILSLINSLGKFRE